MKCLTQKTREQKINDHLFESLSEHGSNDAAERGRRVAALATLSLF